MIEKYGVNYYLIGYYLLIIFLSFNSKIKLRLLLQYFVLRRANLIINKMIMLLARYYDSK